MDFGLNHFLDVDNYNTLEDLKIVCFVWFVLVCFVIIVDYKHEQS